MPSHHLQSVDRWSRSPADPGLAPLLFEVAQRTIAEAASRSEPESAELRARIAAEAEQSHVLQSVINATRVLFHTNLGRSIPSIGVAIDCDITARLRAPTPPVVARVTDERTICDLRTDFPAQDAAAQALAP